MFQSRSILVTVWGLEVVWRRARAFCEGVQEFRHAAPCRVQRLGRKGAGWSSEFINLVGAALSGPAFLFESNSCLCETELQRTGRRKGCDICRRAEVAGQRSWPPHCWRRDGA